MGRGLAAILPRGSREGEGLREIPVELIGPNPRQPRRSFDEGKLAELADSIRVRGVLQPIVVTPLAGGRFELVAGERRLRAARLRRPARARLSSTILASPRRRSGAGWVEAAWRSRTSSGYSPCRRRPSS
jgi:hypothetical protein